MKRALIFAGLLMISMASFSSCQRDRCPTYGHEQQQETPAELNDNKEEKA